MTYIGVDPGKNGAIAALDQHGNVVNIARFSDAETEGRIAVIIADFVADLRAPTPSAAAELAVADGAELLARLAQIRRRMARVTRERLTRSQLAVEALKRGALQRDGEKLLRESVMRLDSARVQLVRSTRNALDALTTRVNEARARHKSHHPARVLERRMDAVAGLRQRFERAGKDNLVSRTEQLVRLRGLLRALGPESAFLSGHPEAR